MSFAAWVQVSRIATGYGQGGRLFFRRSMSSCVRRCQLQLFHTTTHLLGRGNSTLMAKRSLLRPDRMGRYRYATGLPATVAPIGHDERGLPIGVQIIGGYLDDLYTIVFAGLIEREFGGFTAPQNL